jgi:hypothetical protein
MAGIQLFDDIKTYAHGLVDVAKDAKAIRDVWSPPSTVTPDNTANVTRLQAAAQANTAQAQGASAGAVPVSMQWDSAAISRAITGVGGGSSMLLIGGALLLVLLLVMMRR